MTEYIIDWGGIGARLVELYEEGVPPVLWTKRLREERLREKVVRCRDCRFGRIHDGRGAMYCIRWSDGYQGEWTEPDGYCHRAVRRNDDDNGR